MESSILEKPSQKHQWIYCKIISNEVIYTQYNNIIYTRVSSGPRIRLAKQHSKSANIR